MVRRLKGSQKEVINFGDPVIRRHTPRNPKLDGDPPKKKRETHAKKPETGGCPTPPKKTNKQSPLKKRWPRPPKHLLRPALRARPAAQYRPPPWTATRPQRSSTAPTPVFSTHPPSVCFSSVLKKWDAPKNGWFLFGVPFNQHPKWVPPKNASPKFT